MGVMSTLLVVLTAISLKGLLIGATLLLLNLSAVFGKIYLWAHSAKSQWGEEPSGHHKDVHVHIHNGGHHTGSGYYGPYDRGDQFANYYDDPQYAEPYYRRRAYWHSRPPVVAQDKQSVPSSIANLLGGYSNV